MSNKDKKLLNVYHLLEEISETEKQPVITIFRELTEILEDQLALKMAKEFNKTGIATEVYRKYGISESYYRRLISKVQKVTPKPQRKLKEFIYEATKDFNTTHEEYLIIAKYFERRELNKDTAINKLQKIRANSK